MADSAADRVRRALEINRKHALDAVQAGGGNRLRVILKRAEEDLEQRLERAEGLARGQDTYSQAHMRAAIAQVRDVQRELNTRLKGELVSNAKEAGLASAESTVRYLVDAEKAFAGSGSQPLALAEAKIFAGASDHSQASVLRRIAEGAGEARVGILQRYGMETVKYFERELAVGIASKKPWAEIRDSLVEQSPFLQQAPAHWAERIIRTETSAAYNAAGHEAILEADEELGDMVKIIVANFDNRTASDSYATHGQIRRPTEEFDTWYGQMMHPPDRPNDRGSTVPHRISWPLPTSLKWKTDSEIADRWKEHDKRKGSPPPRPLMTTVDVKLFGKKPKEKPKVVDEQKPVAVQVPADLESKDTKPQPEEGKHFGSIDVQGLTKEQREELLSVYSNGNMLGFLEEHLIQKLIVGDIKGKASGAYSKEMVTGKDGIARSKDGWLKMKNDRDPKSYGSKKPLGEVWSFSKGAQTEMEAMQRTLLHETGHHVHRIDDTMDDLVETAWKKGNPVSKYGAKTAGEYFAETFAVFHTDTAALQKHDPVGYKMMTKFLKKRGIL